MRIISGEFRRRLIRGPEGMDTRPMTDRVRTSLFDRLESMGYMDAAAAVDIFAGTGSVGLEALSRGVEHVTFIERDMAAKKLLAQNVADLGLADRTAVLSTNALSPAWLNLLPRRPVALFFADPPYPMSEDEAQRQTLSRMMDQLTAVASDDALLVLRTSEHAQAIPCTKWPEPVTRSYGSMHLHFYQMIPAQAADAQHTADAQDALDDDGTAANDDDTLMDVTDDTR